MHLLLVNLFIVISLMATSVSAWGHLYDAHVPTRKHEVALSLRGTGGDSYFGVNHDNYISYRHFVLEESHSPLFEARIFVSRPVLWDHSHYTGKDTILNFFDSHNLQLADDDHCFEEECDTDCLIPEELKAGVSLDRVDVMRYLGLRRARPLQAST
jgi:hypothetical protein